MKMKSWKDLQNYILTGSVDELQEGEGADGNARHMAVTSCENTDSLIFSLASSPLSSPRDVSMYAVGDEVRVETIAMPGLVRYVGLTPDSDKLWVGVEFPAPVGRSDGKVRGQVNFRSVFYSALLYIVLDYTFVTKQNNFVLWVS